MKYNFHVVCSIGAKFVTKEQRQEIVRQAVCEVEKMKAHHGNAVIFDDTALGLKIVVRFAKKEIHIMTAKEAAEGGLPDKPEWQEPSMN